MGFGAAPVCSETFTMAEDPKASAVGEKTSVTDTSPSFKTKKRGLLTKIRTIDVLQISC